MTTCLAISDQSIAKAVTILSAGQLVAFPTETVYGLGADATNAAAVARIFAAKQRPAFNPLISHVASTNAAFTLGQKTPIATALAAAFWPGPLTLILQRNDDCPVATLTTAGLNKLGIRVPAHRGAQTLLRAFGKPIAAPSANPSGRISPSTAKHVLDWLAFRLDLVLDGGSCESGLESTIVDCTGEVARLLRPGGITREDLTAALAAANCNPQIDIAEPLADNKNPVAPGQLASHYAPKAPVRLMAKTSTDDEELIGFGAVSGAGKLALNLSPSADLVEAAANLFSALHAVDATDIAKIAIAPIPDTGLGEAINDRLRRAAAPR
ncbi:L-threonylcarbamoyladenylate synthase [Alphaproteobacteria bacterium]|nr:L-threonylcarbamoyladenylate synthase [Alphaproteobacteria bacterium]